MDTQRDIDQEKYKDEHEGMCGTCHYWQKDGKGHSCMNLNSPFAADWTDEDDECGHYVPRRGK